MFKISNVIAFSCNAAKVDPAALQQAFAEGALVEPGPLELERIGFVPPVTSQGDIFARSVGHFTAFAVGIKKKMLPGSVVNERLATKVIELAGKEGRKVGGKERKQLREEIVTDMLRHAFIKTSRINAWVDHKNNRLYVDASSRNNAELVVTTIRKALGSFPASPLTAGDAVSVSSSLYTWLREESPPKSMTLGDECVLSLEDGQSTWAGKRVDLCGSEVSEHLDAGSMPKRLGLVFMDRLSFVLDDELVIRKLRLTDVVYDEMGSPAEDALGEFDAHFALIAAEVEQQFACLSEIFAIPELEAS